MTLHNILEQNCKGIFCKELNLASITPTTFFLCFNTYQEREKVKFPLYLYCPHFMSIFY